MVSGRVFSGRVFFFMQVFVFFKQVFVFAGSVFFSQAEFDFASRICFCRQGLILQEVFFLKASCCFFQEVFFPGRLFFSGRVFFFFRQGCFRVQGSGSRRRSPCRPAVRGFRPFAFAPDLRLLTFPTTRAPKKKKKKKLHKAPGARAGGQQERTRTDFSQQLIKI